MTSKAFTVRDSIRAWPIYFYFCLTPSYKTEWFKQSRIDTRNKGSISLQMHYILVHSICHSVDMFFLISKTPDGMKSTKQLSEDIAAAKFPWRDVFHIGTTQDDPKYFKEIARRHYVCSLEGWI